MQFPYGYLLNAIGDAKVVCGTLPTTIFVSINVLDAKEGDCFFLLEGKESVHSIVQTLLTKKISTLIVAQKDRGAIHDILQHGICVIEVQCVKSALYALTKRMRRDRKNIVIAVAGTVGNRGTVFLTSKILNEAGKKTIVFDCTVSNIENVACAIINAVENDTVILFEAVSYKPGDMHSIASILLPSVAIINAIGHRNIDVLGSLTDIAAEQRGIFSHFSQQDVGIINGDQELLSRVSYQHPTVQFGLKISNQIQARKVRVHDTYIACILKMYKEKYPIILKSVHDEIVMITLGAVSIAKLLGVSDAHIIDVIQSSYNIERFFEIKELPGHCGILINDLHSADPESMKATLLAFGRFNKGGKKIVVLGDLEGLGINSAFWHRQIGRFLRKTPMIHSVITVGKYGDFIKKTAPKELSVISVSHWQEVLYHVSEHLAKDSVILVKGAKEVGLEYFVQKMISN